MPQIIVPERRIARPDYQVDGSDFPGLQSIVMADSYRLIDTKGSNNGITTAGVGTAELSQTVLGRSIHIIDGGYIDFGSMDALFESDFTYILHMIVWSTGQTFNAHFVSNSQWSSSGWSMQIKWDRTQQLQITRSSPGGNTVNESSNGALPNDVPVCLFVVRKGNNWKVYADKTLIMDDTTSNYVSNTGRNFVMGDNAGSGTFAPNIDVITQSVIKRAITDIELRSINDNYWQLLEPEDNIIYFPSAGGAPFVADSASGAATIEAFAITQSQALTPTDAVSAATADDVIATQTVQLSVADVASQAEAEAVQATSTHAAAPADLAAQAAADNVATTATQQLIADDANADASLDSVAVTLGSAHNLVVSDASADAVADSPSVTQTQSMIAADVIAAAEAEAVAFAQDHQLTPLPAYSDANIDSVAVTSGAVHNVVADDVVAQAEAEAVAIAQDHQATALPAYSDSPIDSVSVLQDHALLAADSYAQGVIDSTTQFTSGLGDVADTAIRSLTAIRTMKSLTPVRNFRQI